MRLKELVDDLIKVINSWKRIKWSQRLRKKLSDYAAERKLILNSREIFADRAFGITLDKKTLVHTYYERSQIKIDEIDLDTVTKIEITILYPDRIIVYNSNPPNDRLVAIRLVLSEDLDSHSIYFYDHLIDFRWFLHHRLRRAEEWAIVLKRIIGKS